MSRTDCRHEPAGLFGPEFLCPRCGGIVQLRLTAYGWVVAAVAAVVLTLSVVLLQGA